MISGTVLKYKATFRGLSSFPLPKESQRACLNVSINHNSLRGAKLAAILKTADRLFTNMTIMLCDSLNRFTLMLEKNIEEPDAERLSTDSGNQWLKENESVLNNAKIPLKISRWNEWNSTPDFFTIKAQVLVLLHEDIGCRALFNRTAQEYLQRKNLLVSDEALRLSIHYLVEEAAVIRLWALHGYNFELHPSPRSPIVSYTFDKLIKPCDNYLYFSRIDLKKKLGH